MEKVIMIFLTVLTIELATKNWKNKDSNLYIAIKLLELVLIAVQIITLF